DGEVFLLPVSAPLIQADLRYYLNNKNEGIRKPLTSKPQQKCWVFLVMAGLAGSYAPSLSSAGLLLLHHYRKALT
ncbi:hypothetical protein, partial [Oceanisphaera litoralis]|uniref:hypothetical protein n=1 Tax=Oceanisphaera litoralis TaxID=225144 RepID=UPI001957D5C1